MLVSVRLQDWEEASTQRLMLLCVLCCPMKYSVTLVWIFKSIYADHFVSHLAYAPTHRVRSGFPQHSSQPVTLRRIMWLGIGVCLLFWFKWPFAEFALFRITASFKSLQQHNSVLLSLTDIVALPAGYFNVFLSLWLLWCFWAPDYVALCMINDIHRYGMPVDFDFEMVMQQCHVSTDGCSCHTTWL